MEPSLSFMEPIVALTLIALYGAMLYRGVGLRTFTAVTAAVLAGLALSGALGIIGAIIAALALAPLIALNVTGLRRDYITRPVFEIFRQTLPKMSDTEREALNAGDIWWEAELFRGRPDWKQLLDFPYTRLSGEERAFLENETDTLCRMIDDWEVNFERRDLSPEVWDYIRRAGFFGMLIQKPHGGLGFSAYAQSCVVARLATRSTVAAVTVMVPNSLGPGELLQHFGTHEQQAYWLPRLARGEEIPCFALTGPEAGSDAGKIPDIGVVCKRRVDDRETLGISLNFNKRYITLAPVATLIGLAFRLRDPDGLLGDPDRVDYGITCALVPSDTEGLEIGRRHYPGAAFMNGPLRGEDVFVPIDAIIGGPDMAGKGWRMLVECLSAGRGISLPALATASGKGIYAATGAYAAIRRQFNLPIGRFEGVQEALARIGGNAYSLEAARVLTASAVDRCAPSVVTAMMKYHMTEMMRRILIDAMDIHGGRGVIMGPRNYLAIPWTQVPVAITVEGANIMTRNLIIFGQGSIRCHPYVYQEMEAARGGDLAEFDRLLWRHGGYFVNRAARALLLGLSGGRLAAAPVDGPLAGYYRRVERLSAALAFCGDVSLGVLGGELKRRESTSARLGDVFSQLYIATAVLKYYQTRAGASQSEDHLAHARWALDQALHAAGTALETFCHNFPRPLIGAVLRRIVFPFGQPYRRPSDRRNADVAARMMRLNDIAREFLDDIHVGGPAEPTGRLMAAFEKLAEVEPVYERFIRAVNKEDIAGDTLEAQLRDAVAKERLSEGEANSIREYDALRYDAILTDDFEANYIRDPAAALRARETGDQSPPIKRAVP